MQKCVLARACLENLRTIDREINAMLEHRQDILDLACRVTSATTSAPVQRDTGTSRVETGGIRLAEYSLEIDKRVDFLVDLKREAVKMIIQIPDPRLRLVLTMRYINAWDWEKVAKNMGYETSQVYRLHATALLRLDKIMMARESLECAAEGCAAGTA